MGQRSRQLDQGGFCVFFFFKKRLESEVKTKLWCVLNVNLNYLGSIMLAMGVKEGLEQHNGTIKEPWEV